jgi:YegS/Rv2252/BmrU family lipid kinase
MARVLIITNPAAARTDPKVLRTVSTILGREGWDVDVVGTTRPGHAAELAGDGVREGVDVIAVYGGDGTTMQAVQGLMGSEIPVGLIPGGTGNLLAGNLRLPRDPAQAARIIATGVPRAVDLGRLDRADGTRFFAVACGAGFDADLMNTTTTEAKRRWKMGAYVARAAETIVDVRNTPTRVTVDGSLIETAAASVMVVNCPEFVPRLLRFGARVSLDDGLLDVIILSADGFLDSVGTLIELVGGALPGSEGVRFTRGREIRVEMDPVHGVQADGDPAGATPFTARVMPGALRVLVPRNGA